MDIRFFLFILSITNRVQLHPTTSKALDQLAGNRMEWEAWLLIHESLVPKSSDVILKRITPKSIFTVRPFSPDVLPPCPEGYRSDAMGRCVNVIKIDIQSHLGYLVEKFNTMYDPDDYEDDTEEDIADTPTNGPLQFSIPLIENVENESINNNNSSGNISQTFISNNSFNISEIDISNLNLLENTSKSTDNNSLSVIPLTKDIIQNITLKNNYNKQDEQQQEDNNNNNNNNNNNTVLSILNNLMHHNLDRNPPLISPQDDQVSSLKHHSRIKSNLVNITTPTFSDDIVGEENSETIIILFHPLINGTSQQNNKTHSTIQNGSSTTTTTEFSTENIINQSQNHVVTTHLSNIHPDDSNTEMTDDDEFRRNKIFSFLHNADYKAAFFQSLVNSESSSSTIQTNKNSTKEQTISNTTVTNNINKTAPVANNKNETDILTLLSTIARINSNNSTKNNISRILTTENNTSTAKLATANHNNFNHRNRDRNIFWSNNNSSVHNNNTPVTTTSERINSKYYASSPVLPPVLQHSPHHSIFRKTNQQDSDKIINTRRWSNR